MTDKESGRVSRLSQAEPVVSALTGFDPARMNGHTLFSVRAAVMEAIGAPETVLPRIHTDSCLEHEDHWKARAAIAALYTARKSGTAADAIDFALGHLKGGEAMADEVVDFLEDYRSGELGKHPEYLAWVRLQQDRARASRAARA